MIWPASSGPTMRLSSMTLEGWIGEWRSLKAAGEKSD
jgi:hypothetical protein